MTLTDHGQRLALTAVAGALAAWTNAAVSTLEALPAAPDTPTQADMHECASDRESFSWTTPFKDVNTWKVQTTEITITAAVSSCEIDALFASEFAVAAGHDTEVIQMAAPVPEAFILGPADDTDISFIFSVSFAGVAAGFTVQVL